MALSADDISLRTLTPADQDFLWEMLYQALYVPPGAPAFPREIVQQPEISRYVEGWGRSGDTGFVAMDGRQPLAAVWIRLLTGEERGYGYVDDATPELSIAVLPAYRGRGIGARLMERMLAAARSEYPALSLSVSADNPAARLYARLGFERVGESGGSLTMCKRFETTQKQYSSFQLRATKRLHSPPQAPQNGRGNAEFSSSSLRCLCRSLRRLRR
jgi:ribosomal protein S18 acetylase RimI-like enzyme